MERKTKALTGLILTLVFCPTALAGSVWLQQSPRYHQNFLDDLVDMDVWIDFSDELTLGGCVNSDYDTSALAVTGIAMEAIPGVGQSRPNTTTGFVSDCCVGAFSGIGPFPGTTGGADHADNAIDGIGPSAFPDIFHTDTTSDTEFLQITLPGLTTIENLSALGRTDCCGFRDVYDVEFMDDAANVIKSCPRQCADNHAHAALVIPASSSDADSDGIEPVASR